jgi:copper homeostasis protein
MKKILLEICVDSIESAIAAEKGGAGRIELCDNLFEGGTTPSFGMIYLIQKIISIPINVIIRPRGGDFLYSDPEFEVMKRDILLAREIGIDGVVFGILKKDGSIDKKRTKTLVDLARPMSITFHRAFDMTKDPFKSLDDIIGLKIERILTSGQESTASIGSELLQKLIKAAKGRVIIMPGGGINERNYSEVISKCKPKEIHIGGAEFIESEMKFRNKRISMGRNAKPNEYGRFLINSERIKKITG